MVHVVAARAAQRSKRSLEHEHSSNTYDLEDAELVALLVQLSGAQGRRGAHVAHVAAARATQRFKRSLQHEYAVAVW